MGRRSRGGPEQSRSQVGEALQKRQARGPPARKGLQPAALLWLTFSSQSSYEGERTGRAGEQLASASALGGANVGSTRREKRLLNNSQLTARLGFFFLRAHVKTSETQKFATCPPLPLVPVREAGSAAAIASRRESCLLGQSPAKDKWKPRIFRNPSSIEPGRPHSPPEAFPEPVSRAPRQDPSVRRRAATQGFRSGFPTAPSAHRVLPSGY